MIAKISPFAVLEKHKKRWSFFFFFLTTFLSFYNNDLKMCIYIKVVKSYLYSEAINNDLFPVSPTFGESLSIPLTSADSSAAVMKLTSGISIVRMAFEKS